MNEHEFSELSAVRALHALSPDEEQAFSQALAAHPEWQRIVDADRATAAALSAVAAPATPPAAARASILDAIATTPQFEEPPAFIPGAASPQPPVAASPPSRSTAARIPELEDADPLEDPDDSDARRSRRSVGWLLVAGIVAVLLAVSFSFPLSGLLAPRDPVAVALEQVSAAPDAELSTVSIAGAGEATLHWSDSVGQAILVADGLPQIESNRDFELWIVRGTQPVSLGIMKPDAEQNATVLAGGFRPGDAVAVTVEERGGSPTRQPTTDPILAIATPAADPGNNGIGT
ncbi:hypothetical protein FM113_10250 [Leucobacter sp. 7(1)]|uniref:anti-sigma factor n=1 Tax=Leucobacter sp. 7(1) TaxID=1255613 RepID=UPI00097ED814|nr:anti-sigma factor [Leucobacter sp. 7(1)]SJN10831.1 hypothetical protein FM113_10250 [Leucobacter sp. 7(1)]